MLNKIAYNELILAQEDTVCFHIVEEVKTKSTNNGNERKTYKKLSRKFEPTTGEFKTILRKKISKCKLDDVTRNPE